MRVHVNVPTRAAAGVELPAFVTDVRPGREPEHRAAARAAELAGLDGVFVPFDPDGWESLVVAAGLLRDTRRVAVTAAFHPGIATPVYAAKLSASLQRYAGGRLGWLVEVDLDPAAARAQGDFLTGPDRYERADEFLTVAKGVWAEPAFTFEGAHFSVLAGGLPQSRDPQPFPRVHLRGTSAAALSLSARHADVHVLDPGDDPALVPDGVVPAVRLPVRLGETRDLAYAGGPAYTGIASNAGTAAVAGGPGHAGGVPSAAVASGPAYGGGGSSADGAAYAALADGAGAGRLSATSVGDPVHPERRAAVPGPEEVADALADLRRRGFAEVFVEAAAPVADAYVIGQRVLPLLEPVEVRHDG